MGVGSSPRIRVSRQTLTGRRRLPCIMVILRKFALTFSPVEIRAPSTAGL